jgi:hypothetical protein
MITGELQLKRVLSSEGSSGLTAPVTGTLVKLFQAHKEPMSKSVESSLIQRLSPPPPPLKAISASAPLVSSCLELISIINSAHLRMN